MNLFGWHITFRMPKGYDKSIHFCAIALMIFGTIMITSTSVGSTIESDTIVVRTLLRQVVFMIASYIVMIVVANNIRKLASSTFLTVVGVSIIVMLIACLFFPETNGSYAWIRLSLPGVGSFTLQPSEFIKVFMIVIMAYTVDHSKKLERDPRVRFWDIVKIPFAYYAIAAFIILFLQNDSGSFLVLTIICAVCFLIPSNRKLQKMQHYAVIALAMGGVLVCFLTMTDTGLKILSSISFLPQHALKRFLIADNPWLDPTDAGYQLINALYAFATGGIGGLGLGKSIQKMLYLPEAQTDYILPIIVEELGITGFIIILALYALLIWRLFAHAFKVNKEHGDFCRIIYVGTIVYLSVHFFLNVGGVSGLIPLTGVPLLFISSGSSSLLSVCVAIGICQGLIAQEKRLKLQKQKNPF